MSTKPHMTEMEVLKRELMQLAHTCSHDLRDPLREILLLQNKLDPGSLPDQVRHHLQVSEEHIQIVLKKMDVIRQYSGLFSPVEMVSVDLQELLPKVMETLKPQIEKAKATVHLPQQALPTVKGVPDQLEYLFTELLFNALHFRKENQPAVIHMMLENHGDSWRFIIRDNGIGMDFAYKAVACMLFQRLAPHHYPSGVGAGLAFAARIALNHGAPLEITCQENAGFTVAFSLKKAS